MTVRPEIGEKGGQEYDVARAIKGFLQQMAEGRSQLGPTVVKELMQNADDAGADSMSFILDERKPPAGTPAEYSPLCGPALLVRNNAPFRTPLDVEEGDKDDFSAIRDVASGHKRAQATAAGQFGIGFNSVYFLTDLPVIFSRREVHIFDLLHKVFAETNGWRFPLDEFPSHASYAGPIKSVLEWILPKPALEAPQHFGEIAANQTADYQQTLFRLPFRLGDSNKQVLYEDRYQTPIDRLQFLFELIQQASRSLIFLKHLRTISFGILEQNKIQEIAKVEVSPGPADYDDFLGWVKDRANSFDLHDQRTCSFERQITVKSTVSPEGEVGEPQENAWSFAVKHVARFDDPKLLEYRQWLAKNGERAIPWASVAIPLDLQSMRFDGGDCPSWRVFLPLDEPGPCGCVFSAALFVGPSRRTSDFRVDGSDEAKRKTEWNKALVERALLPLFRDASWEMPELLSDFMVQAPKEYLSLFPVATSAKIEPTCLSEHLQACFSAEPWVIHIVDLWGEHFELLTDESNLVFEMVPEWLAKYRDRFQELSTENKRFIPFAFGEALRSRLGDASSVEINRQVCADVYRLVLSHENPPEASDLERLVSRLARDGAPRSDELEGLWCLCGLENAELLRYQADQLYLFADEYPSEGILKDIHMTGLCLAKTTWVTGKKGLTSLSAESRREIKNVIPGDKEAAIPVLGRIEHGEEHDQIAHAMQVEPIVDFLVGLGSGRVPASLHLGFLVRTATNKKNRRYLGSIFLRKEQPSKDEEAIWDGILRRTFAEIDPEFSPVLRRLLDTNPEAIGQLHSEDCKVVMATADSAFDALHRARNADATVIEHLTDHIRLVVERGGASAVNVERAASLLLHMARRQWDSWGSSERATLLALPIHRQSDGLFCSLIEASAKVLPALDSYRLQSEDDLGDAPVDLPDYILLQPQDRDIAQFYRQQLGLEVHGRTAVLKEVLRQIGKDETQEKRNNTFLEYLDRYYRIKIDELSHSHDDADRGDTAELEELMSKSHAVPCVDGRWRVASGCADCSEVARVLVRQGWKRKELPRLLAALFSGESVATIDSKQQPLVNRLHELNALPIEIIYDTAITSESSALSLAQRCKLLIDNQPETPQLIERASIVATQMVPTYAGERELADSVLVPDGDITPSLAKHFYPNGIDIKTFAIRLNVPEHSVPSVLEALAVEVINDTQVKEQVLDLFSSRWADLIGEERVQLLNYVGTHDLGERLSGVVSRLEVIRVGSGEGEWIIPAEVISPKWLDNRPPLLGENQIPLVDGLTANGTGVWCDWCGLKSVAQLLGAVADRAESLTENRRRRAATEISEWLERLHAGGLADEADLTLALVDVPWVFARKGQENAFRRPSGVLVHNGGLILNKEFWAHDIGLPEFISKDPGSWGFMVLPPANVESLSRVVCCLESAGSASPADVKAVYQLLRDLIEENAALREHWATASATSKVFRVFRKPDQLVSSYQLVLGSAEDRDDIGTAIFNLFGSSDSPSGIQSLYRELGIVERVTDWHAFQMLRRMEGTCKGQLRTFQRLVEVLRKSGNKNLEAEELKQVRLPSCDGYFQPLQSCYWDEQWGIPGHAIIESGARLIDTTNDANKRLVAFLDTYYPAVVERLRYVATTKWTELPHITELCATALQVLGPWRDWFAELVRPHSTLRASVHELGLDIPDTPLRIELVGRLQMRFEFDDGFSIEPSDNWEGPPVEHDSDSTILVTQSTAGKDYLADARTLETLDDSVAQMVAELLSPERRPSTKVISKVMSTVHETLERPSTVLERIRRSNEEHFFHQYYDQVADPDFALLFEEFRKTKEGTSRRDELTSRMETILRDKYVKARREQIRGYGYDEVSVFSELVQNAEDAYLQRDILGMDSVQEPFVSFAYVNKGGRALVVEHRGRPFNLWRHGQNEQRNFSRDVEGVLRSAGSYKPLGNDETGRDRTVGRFGLGFKSVFLLTDSPVIHSGQWHFRIDAGCLPETVLPPEDLDPQDTRIILPLLSETKEVMDPKGRHRANLLPFLRRIRGLSLLQGFNAHGK